jgi:arylsulfatase A
MNYKPKLSKSFYLLAVLLAPVAAVCSADDARMVPRPNIVIILADDLGYGDVQCYNPRRGKIPTPNIDHLAAQGMRFTDGHASSGVCSPSRYTLLTGRYHWRTRLQSGIVDVFGEPLIASDRLSLPSLCGQHGYRTAAIGKWHLGWDWPIPQDKRALFCIPTGQDDKLPPTDAHLAAWREVFSQPIPGGPTTRGFDTYFGTDVPNWPPYCFIENDRTIGLPSAFLPRRLRSQRLAGLQGPALPDWKLEPILPTLGDRASQFITRQAEAAQPFFLYLSLTSPHTPLAVTDEWKGKSGLLPYADFVMETDAVIGRVLKAIDASGAAGHTLVVFTSDNGCAPYIGAKELEQKGHFPSGPLRGYKGDAWEGGHRIPFIVRWPGIVRAGSECGQLVHHADLMATMAQILGGKLPTNAGEDSYSLLPLLKGGTQPAREYAISCAMGGQPALRKGAWKLIAAPDVGGPFSQKGAVQPPTKVLLYDLAEDLGETRNLAADKPELVAGMQAQLEKLIRDGRSTPGDTQKNDVEVRRFPAGPKPQHK